MKITQILTRENRKQNRTRLWLKKLQMKKRVGFILLCMGFCTACGNAGTNQVEPVMGTTSPLQKETEINTNLTEKEETTTIQNETESESVTQNGTEKTMQEIYEEIVKTVEQPEMVTLNDNYIANYYGIDLSLLEDYLFVSAEDVIYADTIVLMKVKEESSAQTMKDVLETMIAQKKLELENYLPEQFQIVEKSEVVVTGAYVYLVISEKAEEIQSVIAQYLN